MKYEIICLFPDAESQISQKIDNLLNFSHTLLTGEVDNSEVCVRTLKSVFFPLLRVRVVDNMHRCHILFNL